MLTGFLFGLCIGVSGGVIICALLSVGKMSDLQSELSELVLRDRAANQKVADLQSELSECRAEAANQKVADLQSELSECRAEAAKWKRIAALYVTIT